MYIPLSTIFLVILLWAFVSNPEGSASIVVGLLGLAGLLLIGVGCVYACILYVYNPTFTTSVNKAVAPTVIAMGLVVCVWHGLKRLATEAKVAPEPLVEEELKPEPEHRPHQTKPHKVTEDDMKLRSISNQELWDSIQKRPD